MFLAQIPAATSNEIGAWLVSAAAVAVIVNQVRTLFSWNGKEKREVTFGSEVVTKEHCVNAHIHMVQRIEAVEGDVRAIREEMHTDRAAILASGEDRARRLHERIDVLAEDMPSRVIALLRNTGVIK